MKDAKELFQEGVRAIQEQEDLERGKKLLTESLRIDPDNDKAWVWLSQTVSSTEHKLKCLNKALVINPSNVQAQALKKRLSRAEDDVFAAQASSSRKANTDDYVNYAASQSFGVGSTDQATVVHKAIQRDTLTKILLGLLGLVILAGAGVLSANYLYNFVSGPFPTDAATVASLDNLEGLQNYFVVVTGDEGMETGYQYYEESSGGQEKILANYMALLVEDRFLLVKTPADDLIPRAEYTGTLVEMSTVEKRDIIDDIVSEVPEVKGVFLPFTLDAEENFRTSGYIGLGVGLAVLVLSLWLITTAIQRRSNPSQHPIMCALARFGDPETIAYEIENDLTLGQEQYGNLSLTRNWLLDMSKGAFKATRLKDMVWMYKSITQHRTNGIPTGKTYAAYFWDCHGILINIGGKENQVNTMLEAVAQHTPWVLMGYSDELNDVWNKNREAFLAAVEERKQDNGNRPA